MKLIPHAPNKAFDAAFLKYRPLRSEMELFKANLIRLLSKIDEIEREENQKNHIRDFLRDTFYKETNEINTKGSQDLVIHTGKENKSKVGVIIEAKRPGNMAEMVSAERPNAKALQELVLYYLRERIDEKNIDIKYCIATNINEWFIFDASWFEKLFYRNKAFVKQNEEWRDGKKVTKDTGLFYNDIAKPFIDSIADEIPCTYFDIRKYQKNLKSADKQEDRPLIALLKVLSPFHLLKVPFVDDSNKLKESFYKELLYIIGLEEAKEDGKTVIRRKKDKRNAASLIENTITSLETEDSLHKVSDPSIFGSTKEERIFNIALELCLTWINRILFLKLLEGQLVNYHKGNHDYRFLNSAMIQDFDELFRLFHQVLARIHKERNDSIKEKYIRVPYLNSSLFEISELEDQTIRINALDNSAQLELISSTILKELKKKNERLPVLDYLFKFLGSFDFASEGTEDIEEDNKTLINASVLGKVFEKINGYKDGSIFTPGFITMYMCRQSIRLAVIQKFRETYNWSLDEFGDLKNYLADRKSGKDILEYNAVINSLHICDPAVGSGHFLVSALNEMIAIKSELGLLADDKGDRIRDFEIVVANDELIITDHNRSIFEYQILNGKPLSKEAQRLQKTLFFEKQTIIENSLFGVDINPNSVKICRLRLWIELLKNAYYREETNFEELETLPNIDINIKCNNSLISRFALNADLSKALKSIKYDIKAYRGFVNDYKNEKSREIKRGLQKIINEVKTNFRTYVSQDSKEQKKLNRLSEQLYEKYFKEKLFTQQLTSAQIKDKKDLENEVAAQKKIIDEINNSIIYKNAFEWRFEFPEVLDDNGEFLGFDLVIGNPPYIRAEALGKEIKEVYNSKFKTAFKQYDILVLFFERGIELLKNKRPLSFIVSNKFLISDYGAKLRKHILDNTTFTEAIDISYDDVFKEASVYPYIISLKKENERIKREQNEINFKSSLKFTDSLKIPQCSFMNDENRVFDFTSFEHLWMKKVENNAVPLGEIIKVTRGFRPPKEELKKSSHKSDKYLIGGDLKGPYEIKWSGNNVLYNEKEIQESKPINIFKRPKNTFQRHWFKVQRIL